MPVPVLISLALLPAPIHCDRQYNAREHVEGTHRPPRSDSPDVPSDTDGKDDGDCSVKIVAALLKRGPRGKQPQPPVSAQSTEGPAALCHTQRMNSAHAEQQQQQQQRHAPPRMVVSVRRTAPRYIGRESRVDPPDSCTDRTASRSPGSSAAQRHSRARRDDPLCPPLPSSGDDECECATYGYDDVESDDDKSKFAAGGSTVVSLDMLDSSILLSG